MTAKVLTDAEKAISADLQSLITFSSEKTENDLNNESYFRHASKADLSEQDINRVKNFDKSFAAGMLDATSQVALNAVKADPSLLEKKLSVTVAGVKGETFESTYVGKRSGTIKEAGGGEKHWTNWGTARVAHRSVMTGKGGSLGVAMDEAAAAAEAALKG